MQSKTLSSRFISGLQPKFLWNTKKNHKEILQSIMVLIKIFQIIQLPFQHERKKHTSIQNKTVKWKPNCNELWDKCHGTWFILTWFYNAGSLCLNLPVKSSNSITMNYDTSVTEHGPYWHDFTMLDLSAQILPLKSSNSITMNYEKSVL